MCIINFYLLTYLLTNNAKCQRGRLWSLCDWFIGLYEGLPRDKIRYDMECLERTQKLKDCHSLIYGLSGRQILWIFSNFRLHVLDLEVLLCAHDNTLYTVRNIAK